MVDYLYVYSEPIKPKSMEVPQINKIIVQSYDEVTLLLVCENYEDAHSLDMMLDDYSIAWYKEDGNDNEVHFVLRSPRIGVYQLKGHKPFITNLESVSFVATAYPSKTDHQLISIPGRVLIHLNHPLN